MKGLKQFLESINLIEAANLSRIPSDSSKKQLTLRSIRNNQNHSTIWDSKAVNYLSLQQSPLIIPSQN